MSSTSPVALVTGASRGIGRAVAESLARGGHRVFLSARDAERLERAVAEVTEIGPGADGAAFDLAETGSCEGLLAACRQRMGEPDVLVNNAGTAPTAAAEKTTDAMLEEVLALHVRAPLALVRGVLPAMRERDAGCIVQIASSAGLRGFPFTAAYTAGKHGMVGLTRALAAELAGSGVRVYAVCPGFVDTDVTRGAAEAVAARGRSTAAEVLERMAAQNRIGRMHVPAEVGEVVARLCLERPDGTVYDMDRQPAGFIDRS